MSVSSHEEKMLSLQHQMRQNQSELQSYLAGLDDWQSEIKEKEKKLKSSESDKAGVLPPVRNTIEKKKMKKKKRERNVDPSKPKRISGYDFRAWDKFDVDKALEDVDGSDEKKETSSSEYETDEEWEMERKRHLAGQEKDKGNKFLKNGDLERAVEAYTKGMEFDSTNSILPANRALALIKQQKFAAAELDCTTSIVLDPLYVKAYLRRATARAGIGRTQDAIADYQRVLDLEPANKQAKADLERMEKELQREKEGPVQSSFTEGQRGMVKPVYKSPADRSKVPMKRIDIEEIGVEVASRPQRSSTAQTEAVQKIEAKEKQAFDSLFTTASVQAPTSALSSRKTANPTNTRDNKDTQVVKSNGISELSDTGANTGPSQHAPQGSTVAQSAGSNQAGFLEASAVNRKVTTELRQSSNPVSSSPRATEASGGGDGHSFQVPQSSFQFQADFKLLKKKPEQFCQYFQAIPPSQYPRLFGQCLDADILNAILRAVHLSQDESQVDSFEVLLNLTLVKRFTMTAMFLSKKDKKVVEDLLSHISEKGLHSAQEVNDLRQKYQL